MEGIKYVIRYVFSMANTTVLTFGTYRFSILSYWIGLIALLIIVEFVRSIFSD